MNAAPKFPFYEIGRIAFQTQLGSTVIGLGTTGYLSTIVWGPVVSTANLAGHISTANLAGLVSTANLAGHVSTANLANLISTANLAGHISTANLANLVSTANLAGLVSTANLATLISTSYLATQLGSTVVGLSNVAVTQITAGSRIYISPTGGTGNVTVNSDTPSDWAGYAASTNVDLAGHSITNAGSVLAGYVYSSSGFGYAGIQFSTNDINIIPYAAGGGNVNITNGNLDMCNNNITNLCNINGSAYPPPSSWVGTATTDLDMCNYSINNVNNISASNVYYHSVLSNIDGVQTDFSVGYLGLNVWNNSGPGTYNYAPVFALYTLSVAFAAGGNSYYLIDGKGTTVSGGIQAFVAFNSNEGGPASLYISTLYFGNYGATINGQLTTDSTATNLYWQGNQINNPPSWVGTATTDLDMCNYSINNVNNISASNVYYHSVLSNIDGIYQTDFSVGYLGLNVWNNSGPGTYNYAPVFAQVYITSANSPGGNTYYFLDGLGTGASGSIQAFVAVNSNATGPASLYISTLYFGNSGATINGQLTTDSTATNLYWQGNQINPINGSFSVSASYGYTANVSVGISGLTLGGIVMITPLDDLTEGGATIITYSCVPNVGFFTIYLNVPSSFSFSVINYYHYFMYNVVAL